MTRNLILGGAALALFTACGVAEDGDYRGGHDDGWEEGGDWTAGDDDGRDEKKDECCEKGGVGCVIDEVERCVCSFDSYCCEVEWDHICVAEAIGQCGLECEDKKDHCDPRDKDCEDHEDRCDPRKEDCDKKDDCDPRKEDCDKKDDCDPKKEDCDKKDDCDPKKEDCDKKDDKDCDKDHDDKKKTCCEPHEGPGCEIGWVESCVCDRDPYCCNTEWDYICVEEALECGLHCDGREKKDHFRDDGGDDGRDDGADSD